MKAIAALGRGRRGGWYLLLPLLGLLAGCADHYSDAVVYELRQDPIVRTKPVKGENFPYTYKPDPPGQLPVLAMSSLLDKRNPLHFIQNRDITLVDPVGLSANDRKTFTETLDKLFGTPGKPRVTIPGVSSEDVDALRLDRVTLTAGSKLYRLHCLACHGVTGNGRGPSAQWVNPHPRDYRQGLFKFQSVDQTKATEKLKPAREDLFRTLYYGIENTSMPAFNLLSTEELEALVSYVIHLSIRGEAEFKAFSGLIEEEEVEQPDKKKVKVIKFKSSDPKVNPVIKGAQDVFGVWKQSQKLLIKEADFPTYSGDEKQQSILRGRAMFLANVEMLKEVFPKDQFVKKYSKVFKEKDKDGKEVLKPADKVTTEEYEAKLSAFATSVSCVTCHMDYGRQAQWELDEWGTMVKAANLTVPVYRGGRRPVDLFYRLHSGINGSGMVDFGRNLNGEQVWDLVNFVQILPYPAMRSKYGIQID